MRKIFALVVVVGLAAFAGFRVVRWYAGGGKGDQPPGATSRPAGRPVGIAGGPYVHPSIIRPDDVESIGSIRTPQSVVFDTGTGKDVPTVTVQGRTLRGEVRTVEGVDVAVYCFDDVFLENAVEVRGKLPLAIVSKGTIRVYRRLSISGGGASGASGGAGVCGGHDGGAAGSAGQGPGGGASGRGAAGGSYGGAGTDGVEGKAGAAYGQSHIRRMVGGSGGGGGAAGGGAGGGVIQLSAAKSIEIAPAGSIVADGGAGVVSTSGSGGGGSGGAVLLSAPVIAVKGQIFVRGGNGAGGGQGPFGGAGGGGRIAVFYTQSFSGTLPVASHAATGGRTPGGRPAQARHGSVVPTDSLAWWTFERIHSGIQGSVAVDSMNRSHAILWNVEDSALVPGVCGRGLQLDGEQAYVEVYSRDPISRLGTGEMTIALWVRTEVLADKAVLVGKGMPMVEGGELLEQWRQAGYGKRFVIQKRGTQIVFAVEEISKQSQVAVAAEDVETGQWVHLAAVRDTKNRMLRLFVNGRQLAEGADQTGNVSNQLSLYIGAGEDGSVKNHGRAAIDDVRVFAAALDGDALTGLIRHAMVVGAAGFDPALSDVVIPRPNEPWLDPTLTAAEKRAIEALWRRGHEDKARQALERFRQRNEQRARNVLRLEEARLQRERAARERR